MHGRRKPLAAAATLVAAGAAIVALSAVVAGSGAEARATAGLPYSTASNAVIQRQPAPGSCHARGAGLYSRPDPRCTPGALNPQVTQATSGRTICRAGWTATVRPPESISEPEKRASMAAYGDRGPIWGYEYDHLVPLELGGATNDPRNLWPEPGASPNPKDAIEDELRADVCDGRMSLAAAQRAIAANWVALARAPAPSAPSRRGARCEAAARYSSSYGDYDVYVRSNQPDQAVTVTGSGGVSARWHTDASGSADVYVQASPAQAGEQVIVRAGGAVCSTTL